MQSCEPNTSATTLIDIMADHAGPLPITQHLLEYVNLVRMTDVTLQPNATKCIRHVYPC